jgi:hypothetical protein
MTSESANPCPGCNEREKTHRVRMRLSGFEVMRCDMMCLTCCAKQVDRMRETMAQYGDVLIEIV